MRRTLFNPIPFVLICWLCLCTAMTFAQSRISGKVVEANSHKFISGATIKTKSGKLLASTDTEGNFVLDVTDSVKLILISAMGYLEEHVPVENKSFLDIHLHHKSIAIDEVHVSRKQKYNNRNPATELIDLVLKHKNENKLEKKDSLYFEVYDKVKMGIINPNKVLGKAPIDLDFFISNVDTLIVPGKEAVNILMKESIADVYVQQNPSRQKKIIKAERTTEFDARFINNGNIAEFLDYMFQPIDIYEESIYLLNKQFLSPIANNAKLYYKYYVVDTIRNGSELAIRLKFEPRNTKDLLFFGDLIVSMDGRYAVQGANLFIDEKSNISWVSDIRLRLSYFKNDEGIMLQDTSEVFVAFGRSKNEVTYGHRIGVNSKYDLKFSIQEDIMLGAPIERKINPQFSLDQHRPVALSSSEETTYTNIDRLNNTSSFKRMLALGYLLSQGYYSLGKVELGPLEYLYHENPIEGNRIRIGGRTTAAFSDKMYLEGYMAYGVKDKDIKYNLRTAVTLNGKPITTFPAHYMEGFVQHDIFEPGKGIGFLKGDGFFRSFRSNPPTKYLNTDAYRLGHLIEFGNHVSLSTSMTVQRRNPIGDMQFVWAGQPSVLMENLNTADLQFLWRWAPNEKFYYRNLQRTTIVQREPLFTLQYNKGFRGFLGGQYNYDALRAAVAKRFFMNQFGFANVVLSGGQIWGTLPYPLLEIPTIAEMRDRTSISYERTESMEFVADKFLKFSYDHKLGGFLLNRIPLIRQLKWRELFGAKMFWGSLSDKNNPYKSNQVIDFEKDDEGKVMTRIMSNQPYWEGYVGLENIFKVLTVKYFVRMTYDDIPETYRDRLRFSFRFSF